MPPAVCSWSVLHRGDDAEALQDIAHAEIAGQAPPAPAIASIMRPASHDILRRVAHRSTGQDTPDRHPHGFLGLHRPRLTGRPVGLKPCSTALSSRSWASALVLVVPLAFTPPGVLNRNFPLSVLVTFVGMIHLPVTFMTYT